MEFKPTKEQVLRAWEDRDEGRTLSKDMDLYLDELERIEDKNTESAEDTKIAVKSALRAELRSLEIELSEEIAALRLVGGNFNKILLTEKAIRLYDDAMKIRGKI